MNFKHAEWRKLYREESGEFARLPWFARAAASHLLKPCDDDGRIAIGPLRVGESPAEALMRTIAFRMGATRGDRRLMVKLFPLLFAEGFLVHAPPYVLVRNFVAGQNGWNVQEQKSGQPSRPSSEAPPKDPPKAPTEPVPTTTEPRPSHDRAMTGESSGTDQGVIVPRSSHDGATKEELTPRNDTTETPRARAYARSSVPFRSVPNTESKVDLANSADGSPGSEPTPKPSTEDPVVTIWDHWRAVMKSPRSKLDRKRRARIEWALKTYTVNECLRAIDGCSRDSFSMGENDRETRYNDVSLIFRDAHHVEKFLELAPLPKQRTSTPPPPPTPIITEEQRARTIASRKKALAVAMSMGSK